MNLTRRKFLKQSLGASSLLALGGAVPSFLSRTAQAAGGAGKGGDTILVVIQLSGGNDGLNTVVPYEMDAYHRSRSTLRLRADQVHKLGSGLGFHPEMAAFHRLFQEGHLSVIQGVGYPNSKRDHDAAKRDWHSARPSDTGTQTGWAGRAIDSAYIPAGSGVPGVFTGEIKAPFGLQTEQAFVPGIRTLDQWLLPPAAASGHGNLEQALIRLAQPSRAAAKNPLLDFVQQTTLDACARNRRIQTVLQSGATAAATYPQFPLAQTLHSVAQLIRADLGIRIYFAELGGGEIGGFDSHAGQFANHNVLLRELSESVAAFVQDLRRDKRLDSVMLMTFSEFGRSLTENGRRGTDHGAAAPMFVAGGKLKGGLVGAHPSLTDLINDAPKFHTDFRRVYATMLDRWLGFDSAAILGEKFAPLDGVLG